VFQSSWEVTQRLIVRADEQLARSRAASTQARAWITWFEVALDEAEALPEQVLPPGMLTLRQQCEVSPS
jgi:hypothetical protein